MPLGRVDRPALESQVGHYLSGESGRSMSLGDSVFSSAKWVWLSLSQKCIISKGIHMSMI